MKLGLNNLYSPNRIFIIPDVQGNYDKLGMLISKIRKEFKEGDHIVFCGDYVGFNKLNIRTLELLQLIKEEFNDVFFICGNHDDSLLNFLQNKNQKNFIDINTFTNELLNRGHHKFSKEILVNLLNEKNIKFLYNMIPYYETSSVLITHAPLDYEVTRLYKLEEGIIDKMQFDLMYNFVKEENVPIKGMSKWLICGHQNNKGKRLYPCVYPESKRAFLDCFDNDLFAMVFPSKRIIKN